jgi:hypothetical protein
MRFGRTDLLLKKGTVMEKYPEARLVVDAIANCDSGIPTMLESAAEEENCLREGRRIGDRAEA